MPWPMQDRATRSKLVGEGSFEEEFKCRKDLTSSSAVRTSARGGVNRGGDGDERHFVSCVGLELHTWLLARCET